jgi:hypothetical protein
MAKPDGVKFGSVLARVLKMDLARDYPLSHLFVCTATSLELTQIHLGQHI